MTNKPQERTVICPVCEQKIVVVIETNPATGRALFDKLAWHQVEVAMVGAWLSPRGKHIKKMMIDCPANQAEVSFEVKED